MKHITTSLGSVGRTVITLVQGDITTQVVDAIVNAANPELRSGGGVSGAIHRAAGPELTALCRTLGGCLTGQAVLTPGYQLPARWVAHTVAPVFGAHHGQEAELLAHCYRSCLVVAAEQGARTIAFPSLGTGTYEYPVEQAAPIAVRSVRTWLAANPDMFDEVRFVVFNTTVADCYRQSLAQDGVTHEY